MTYDEYKNITAILEERREFFHNQIIHIDDNMGILFEEWLRNTDLSEIEKIKETSLLDFIRKLFNFGLIP